MLKRFSLALIQMVWILSLSSTAYASDINLSSLSDSNAESHNHILESKYNATNHWQECLICKQQLDIQKHSF